MGQVMVEASAGARPRGKLAPCRRCGETDPNRMYALMSAWFAAVVGLPVDHGYFYLCPRCYEACTTTTDLPL